MMIDVYVSVGSNIERKLHIREGLLRLQSEYGDIASSPMYETDPVGFEGEPFYNSVIKYQTAQTPSKVASTLKHIESLQKRVRGGSKFVPRTLDLDLVLYNNEIITEGKLQLPRDEIYKFAFVLQPLSDIAPDLVCPLTHKTYLQLWKEFTDKDETTKVIDWDPLTQS